MGESDQLAGRRGCDESGDLQLKGRGVGGAGGKKVKR